MNPCTSPACRRACPCPAACHLADETVIGEDEGGPMLALSPDESAGLLVCMCIAFLALVAVLHNLPG